MWRCALPVSWILNFPFLPAWTLNFLEPTLRTFARGGLAAACTADALTSDAVPEQAVTESAGHVIRSTTLPCRSRRSVWDPRKRAPGKTCGLATGCVTERVVLADVP